MEISSVHNKLHENKAIGWTSCLCWSHPLKIQWMQSKTCSVPKPKGNFNLDWEGYSFIQIFSLADNTEPLYKLIKKNVPFTMKETHAIGKKLLTPLLLKPFQPGKPITVTCDASWKW